MLAGRGEIPAELTVWKDLTVAWYDHMKAYDRVPHSVVDMTHRAVGAPAWLRQDVQKVRAGRRTKYEIVVNNTFNLIRDRWF